MFVEPDIQEKLSSVLEGNLSVWKFHSWLQDISWQMPSDSSPDFVGRVGDILNIFDEYYHDEMDERLLIEKLRSLPFAIVSIPSGIEAVIGYGASYHPFAHSSAAKSASMIRELEFTS